MRHCTKQPNALNSANARSIVLTGIESVRTAAIHYRSLIMNKRRAIPLSVSFAFVLGLSAQLSLDAFAGPPLPPPVMNQYGAAGGAVAAGAIIGAAALQNGGANGSVTVGAPPSNGRNCQEVSSTYTTNNACGTGSYTYSTGGSTGTGMQQMPTQTPAPQQ
jgi:hypothetical protein